MKFGKYRSNVIVLGSVGQKASSSGKYALEFLYAITWTDHIIESYRSPVWM